MSRSIKLAKEASHLLCFIFLFLIVSNLQAQNPGGVPGYAHWITNHEDPEDYNHQKAKSKDRVGSYLGLSDTIVLNYFDSISFRSTGSSLFVVVKPVFKSSKDTNQLNISGSQILKSHIVTRWDSSDYSFEKYKPQIITIVMPRSTAHPRLQKFISKSLDRDFFDITELIYYDRVLSGIEVRKVESYLAFKYGINIVKDTTAYLNDYYSADSVSYWDYSIDSDFRDVILGLGRNDSTNFKLTQAVTADSNDMVFAIDSVTELGFMPIKSLNHGDFITFCKDEQPADSSCAIKSGYSLINGIWKLRKFQWDSPNQNLIIGVRSASNWNPQDSAVLWVSDGISEWIYQKIQDKQKYRYFSIPIDSLIVGADYYFEVIEISSYCDQTLNVFSVANSTCSEPLGGALRVSASPSYLPAQLTLQNISLGINMNYVVTDPLTDITELPAGQYRIIVSPKDNAKQLFVRWIAPNYWVANSSLSNSKVELEMSPLDGSVDQACQLTVGIDQIGQLSGVSEPVLKVYPVPAQSAEVVHFELENPEGFTGEILLTDALGRELKRWAFSEKEFHQWTYQFSSPGIYHLDMRTEFHRITKEIVIQ